MFLRVSLLCVTVSIFLRYILAVPLPDGVSTTGPGQVSKEGLNENKTVGNKREQFDEELDTSMGPNRAIIFNRVSWIFDMTTYLHQELVTMAGGVHYIFPLSEKNETDQEHKTISIAVSKLLMNLKTMERAREVETNVREDLENELFIRFDFSQKSDEAMRRTVLQEFFIILNNQMETDKELGDEYKKKINEAREIVNRNPEMSEPLTNRIGIKSIDEIFRIVIRPLLNDLFFNESNVKSSNSSDYELIERCSLAKAVIQKAAASSSSESKVNDQYQRALTEARELLENGQHWPIKVPKEIRDKKIKNGRTNEGVDIKSLFSVGDVLFYALENALKLDPVLYKEVESLKKQNVEKCRGRTRKTSTND